MAGGDALIRTIGIHMLLNPGDVYHFDDIGYEHQKVCYRAFCTTDVECVADLPNGIGKCAHTSSQTGRQSMRIPQFSDLLVSPFFYST